MWACAGEDDDDGADAEDEAGGCGSCRERALVVLVRDISGADMRGAL